MLKAEPDLLLPAAIVAFDRGLKATLARWSEHRRHAETQRHAHDAADDIAMLMRSLKACVVVELHIGWQTDGLPVLDERLDDRCSLDGACYGPGTDQRPVQRDHVEHLDLRPTFDVKAFDDVDLVEFSHASEQIGQIPSCPRRWPANTPV